MLNEKLIELRKKAGLSQGDLADKLYCSRSLVAKWEQGRAIPSKENLINLASIFQVDYHLLESESIPSNILSTSFSTTLNECFSISLSYSFFPYLFSLLMALLLYIALGVFCGLMIGKHDGNGQKYVVILLIGLILLSIPTSIIGYKLKKYAKGGVGLATKINKEKETVSIDTKNNEINININLNFNGEKNIFSTMNIQYIKEKRKYFIVGENRKHNAILPKKYISTEIIEWLKSKTN